ncbi:hypothetical protein AC249_AIPGENE14178 [Exaiptasia diaphana]|nr:hypothetical protein AC249_AIPGENE14178 [Exaiptasia diaphana]
MAHDIEVVLAPTQHLLMVERTALDLTMRHRTAIALKLSTYLQPVLQDASKSRWVRCWRAASDGWDVTKTFHPKCDNKGPTVTIVRVDRYIFGGYSDVSWDSK